MGSLFDDQILRRTGRELRADDALEEQVGGVAEDLGPDDVESDGDRRQRDTGGHDEALWAQRPDETLGAHVEVGGLFTAGAPVRAAAHAGAVLGALVGDNLLWCFFAHAVASALSWELTISW